MSIFGQIESVKTDGGIVHHAANLCFGADLDSALAKAFAPELVKAEIAAKRFWVLMPDDTKAGATLSLDGDGHVVSAVNPVIVVAKVAKTGGAFNAHCATMLATLNKTDEAGGFERFDEILAAIESSTAKMMTLTRKVYQAALTVGGRFTYDDAVRLFPYIVQNGASGTMTADEATAIIAGW